MKKYKPSQVPKHGRFICIYSQSGVGKTVSTLKTLPKPCIWIPTEGRDLSSPLEAAGVGEEDVIIAPYEDLEDALEFLSDHSNFDGIKSIFWDSLTYSMAIQLMKEVGDEAFEARSDKKVDKKLASMMKLTMESQGVINKSVLRILDLLTKIVATGKVVVVSCLETERPKYNRELVGAPALGGKEVPAVFPGFFDLIGYLKPRVVRNKETGVEKVVYPPQVSFESDGSYLAKYTGKDGKKEGPLDFAKILGS